MEREQRSSMGLGDFLLGAMVGGLVGGLVGMMLAPRPGRDTRHQVGEGFSNAQDSANKLLEEAKANSEDLIRSTRASLEEKISLLMDAIDAGRKAASEKRREWFGEEQGMIEAKGEASVKGG